MLDTLTISYEFGEFLVDSTDDEPSDGDDYYEYRYISVIPEEGDDPVSNLWYEKTGDNYHRSQDLEADLEKEYYVYGLVKVEPEDGDNPEELGWYEMTEPETYTTLTSTLTLITNLNEEAVEFEDVVE